MCKSKIKTREAWKDSRMDAQMTTLHLMIGLFVGCALPTLIVAWVERKGYFK